MNQRFAHLATRLFNVPLMILPDKAEIIMAALAARLGIGTVVNVAGDVVFDRMTAMEDDEVIYTGSGGPVEHDPPRGYDVLPGGVALISIEGTLVNKLGTLRPWSGMTGYDGIRQNYLTALTDPDVRGIVLDIDSPGGECAGCFDLADTIFQTRDVKPSRAILSEDAFSAAYMLACATSHISVPRTGGTGSIGIVWCHVDWSAALDKAGLRVTFIKRGERKIDGASEIPLSEEAKKRFQIDVDAVGELFEESVARNRSIAVGAIRDMQALTFQGQQGVTQGLADEVAAPDVAFRSFLETLG